MEDARVKYHAAIICNDKMLLENLTATAMDSGDLLAKMMKDHAFPLPNLIYQACSASDLSGYIRHCK